MSVCATNSNAQGTLLYYWNFNSWTPTYTSPTPVSGTAGGLGIYASIAADYAAPGHDTAKARFVNRTIPGTSASYTTYCDAASPGDTLNARMGDPAGTGVKARNPNDSMELLIYAPTTNYTNLQIKYACESSSYTSGDSINIFSYSVDSGTTWISSGAGLSEWIDSGSLAYRLVSVHVNDVAASNNPKFVFKINLKGRNTGGTGNNRYDNVTIEGDSISLTLGVAQIAAPSYSLYPNPAAEVLNITASTSGNKSVIVTNIVGQEVIAETKSGSSFPVSIANLASGVYYVTIRENESGNSTTLKFVKN